MNDVIISNFPPDILEPCATRSVDVRTQIVPTAAPIDDVRWQIREDAKPYLGLELLFLGSVG